MTEMMLSEAEKAFIHHGVQADLRVDGRPRLSYRPILVETGLVSNASGSARLRLANSDVLVGVKVELDTPAPDRPSEGRLEFFVDCSANATPEFEGRGGEDLANEISRFLHRAYSAGALNLGDLCVLPGQQCWVLYIDILILECGGNLFDAVSLAVKAALHSTRIPSVRVAAMDGGEPELELSDDPFDTKRIDTINAPCIVTLSKIGNHFVIDPTVEEESCSSASLLVSVTAQQNVTAVRKVGSGSLHPDTLTTMLQTGREVGSSLNTILLAKLKEEERLNPSQKVGFLR